MNAGIDIAGRLKQARYAFVMVARRAAIENATTFAAAILGAAVVVLIALPLAAALNIWVDEAFTLHTTGAGPLVAWHQAIVFEGQPPFYFVVESLWRRLDEGSVVFARLPSILFASAAVAIITLAAYRISPRIPSVVVALTTALNPIIIWAAVEMRLYALLLLIAAVLTWAFFEGFLVENRSPRARIWYAVFAIIGLYTQYYVGFMLAAHLLTLIIVRRRSLRAHIITMAIVAVTFAPFTPVVLMHLRGSGDFIERSSFLHAAHVILNAIFVFVLPHDIEWTGAAKLAGFGIAVALAIALFVFGRPATPARPQRGVVIAWFISAVIFSVMFGLTGVPADPLRHVVIMAPPSLLVALLLIALLTRWSRFAGGVVLAVFALFAMTQFWSQYHPPLSKQGDWQRVAALLSTEDRSVPIAVFPAESAFPLGWYLPRATIIVPKPMPLTTDYIRATTLNAQTDVARVLDPVRYRSASLLLVTNGECPAIEPVDYNYHCRFLEAYLRGHYRIVRSDAFHGALVRLFTRRSDISSTTRVSTPAN